MEKDWIRSLLWYSLLPLLFVMAVSAFIGGNRTEVLTYSEFKTLLKAGKLNKVTVQELEISGTIKNEDLGNLLPKEKIADIQRTGGSNRAFSTVRIADPALLQDLDAAKVDYAGELENHLLSNLASWILPTLIFVVVWFYAMRRLSGGPSSGKGFGIGSGMLEIGKSRAKVYMETLPGVTFDDVAGIDEAKEELIEIVQFLK
ncbi:MAG TPA: ATP-dependent metallopeptidase FtsH/Yme1/Tma family protein, partial [Burkholderiaceae bacterium]